MEPTDRKTEEPLAEAAPDEAVVRALLQSAYPVEFVEANRREEENADDA